MTDLPPAAKPLFERRQIGNTLVLVPGENLREFEFDRIEAAAEDTLKQVDSRAVTNVVIDFRNTDFYGSTALSFFVKLWKRIRSVRGQFAFCNVSRHEKEILNVTRLDSLWPCCESLEEALALVEHRK